MSTADSLDKIKTTTLLNNEFLELISLDQYDTAMAVAKKNYIPIEVFKSSFEEVPKKIEDHGWSNFIFDKSALDTFHQPSMEWYYTEWKKALMEKGLSKHFKILPELPWFKTSVQAGINEIKQKHPDFNFDAFEVRYIDSIDEAIQLISEEQQN